MTDVNRANRANIGGHGWSKDQPFRKLVLMAAAIVVVGGALAVPRVTDLLTKMDLIEGIHNSQHHASSHREGSAANAARPATEVRPISCQKLPNVPGKSVTTAFVYFPPNAYTAAHRHPGSVTAYVLKGSVRSQMGGGAPVTYQAGETWFEAPGALHSFAENASKTEPAELLAIFVAEDYCGPLVIPEK